MNLSDAEYSTIRDQAIRELAGKELSLGTAVAHRGYRLIVTLLRYDGDDAVTKDVGGQEMRFPKSEIFDVNALKDRIFELAAAMTVSKIFLGG